MKLTHEQMAALKALGAASHGTFDPWRIAGDRNAALRQSILMGLTAIRAALMRVADIDGAGLCEAAVATTMRERYYVGLAGNAKQPTAHNLTPSSAHSTHCQSVADAERLARDFQNEPMKDGGRWIENPAAAGLRFLGWSDELGACLGKEGGPPPDGRPDLRLSP